MAPRNSGARTASPRPTCQGALAPEPCITKSKHGPPTTLSCRGSVLPISMPSAPSHLSSAMAFTQVGIPYKRGVPLSSHACIAGASYACVTSAPCTNSSLGISSTNSPSTNASWRTIVGCEELGRALLGSPALAADGTEKVGCGGATGHAANRQTIEDDEV
jgi:hypothetical protein